MDDKLQPIRLTEIQVGKPLAWSVYNKAGKLLLGEGALVESQRQLEGLSENGLYRAGGYSAPVTRRVKTDTDSVAAKSSGPAEKIEDLQSLKLAIGDTVQLQDVTSDKNRCFVKLIGFMAKRSVLVSHPRQDDKLTFIKQGQGYVVRGFSGTKTYEFASNVISVCLSPYPYLHLAFPEQVKTTNMRGAVRIKLRLVCSIESKATGLKAPAIIEDMSISGARIHAKTPFGKVGDEVTVGLRMQVGGEAQVFSVSAVIRNVRAETDSQTNSEIVMHGMEFVQTTGIDLTVLQNFIYKSMLES
jgi:c-di-GMP-binding flagellar brake protein YcgR